MNFGAWFRRHVIESFVKDVPPDVYACELCGECSCSESKFAACEFRIHSEFLERRNRLAPARTPADSIRGVEPDMGTFEVVSLSPGILPEVVSATRKTGASDDDADSSAKSGFRTAIGRAKLEPVEQSVTIELDEIDPGAPTRRSAER